MRTLTLATLGLTALLLATSTALAGGGHNGQCCGDCECGRTRGKEARAAERAAGWDQASGENWHCNYYNPEWTGPVALVVPPTAEKYREMGWGVGNTRMRRIYPQFSRQYPGPFTGGSEGFAPMPPWPRDTTQAGYYYVRGPW